MCLSRIHIIRCFGSRTSRNLQDICRCFIASFFKFLKKFWYQPDIFFLGDELYVPKPSKDGKSIEWRKSYSCKEKDLFKKIDGVNECRKHCVRITKALFKLRSNGLFKEFTSYCIKTIAFQLKDNKGIEWKEKNLGECVIFFLKKIQKHLEERNLHHTFDRSINLLEEIKCDQLSNRLKNILKSENNFTKWLNSPNEMTT